LRDYDITLCRAEQASRVKKKLEAYKKEKKLDGDELQALVHSKSKAAGGLFKWVTCTD
jgi:hypothetical protein